MFIKSKTAIVPYRSDTEAKTALKELRHFGFDMNRVSVIGCDHFLAEHVVGYHTAGDRVRNWGSRREFWGGIWGPLFGCASVLIPDSGPLVIAGPLVGWIVEVLEEAVLKDGVNAIRITLVSLCVPEESVQEYEAALRSGKCLVIAHGSEADAKLARKILTVTHPDVCVGSPQRWTTKHSWRSIVGFRGSAQREREQSAQRQ